jgi:hypothetical protein
VFLSPDPEGVDSVFVVVKATFRLGSQLAEAEDQMPIVIADQYRGEPGESSIAVPSDVSLVKPGTDVLILGSAFPPQGRPARRCVLSLRVGPVEKHVAVYGDRRWEVGLARTKPSEPAPFEKMPLIWERAFGGKDSIPGSPASSVEQRNPVGVGFRTTRNGRRVDGDRLPNLELVGDPIGSPNDRPTPAGVGPVCPYWEPRLSRAGTYDAEWTTRRAPYLPKNFDSRFFHIAPSDQVVPGYLRGGEPAEIVGVSPAGPLRFSVPKTRVEVTFRFDDGVPKAPANLDTVAIDSDHSRLVLIWRAAMACDKRALRLREIGVALASAA